MSGEKKNILQYVGDDGEFVYAIDEYAEGMLSGKLKNSHSLEDNDDWFYPSKYIARSNMWVVKFIAVAIGLTLLIIPILIHSDQSFLYEHSDEILDETMDYQACTAEFTSLIDGIFVYTVGSDGIHISGIIQPQSTVKIRAPLPDRGWYQLRGYYEAGEGIVLAKYFTEVVCE